MGLLVDDNGDNNGRERGGSWYSNLQLKYILCVI